MSTGSSARVIRAPGRLVVNPTQAFDGGTFPFNGTDVGRVNACALASDGSAIQVEAEDFGEVVDVLEGNQKWVFACFVRGWDSDAIRLFQPDGYSVGAVSQHAVFSAPGESKTNSSALARAVSLVFVPDDIVNVPALMIYRAVPDWTPGSEFAFQRKAELGLPITFQCVRDTSGRYLKMGRLVDLAL